MFRSILLAVVLLPALLLAADSKQCLRCHPMETADFENSAMGHSVSNIASQPNGRISHRESGSKIIIRRDGDGKMIQEIHARGLLADYPIAYTVGAGKVGFSYLISIPPFLFQSPASFYSQAGIWDLTPGYEPERTLDFTHPITEGCVFCHANKPNLKAGTEDQFIEPALTAISCERCHGPTANHLQRPVPGSIVNPAKLAPAARDSVCEQCHLEGAVRILNPEKKWGDFTAGQTLESVFTTFVNRSLPDEATKAVSQAEQLSLSRCARESGGRLWCGTCHSPHSVGSNRAVQVRTACLGCHAQTFAQQKHKPADECVSCHMPALRPSNVAHAAITNHAIAIPGRQHSTEQARQPGALSISPWRTPPEYAARNLALAIFQSGADEKDSPEILTSYDMLAHLPKRDPVVAATLGAILLEQGYLPQAVHQLHQASEAEPENARYAFLLGSAYMRQGNQTAAIQQFRRSISLNRSSPDPYRALANLYEKAGEAAQSRQVIQEYLDFMPKNFEFRETH